MAMSPESVRFGILGAARVAGLGLIRPARATPGARVLAIASRSLPRAQAFAARLGVEIALGSYDELLERDDIDAVYVALPPALHDYWVRRALDSGKSVLCEKPLTVNASLSEALVRDAAYSGRVLQEGMHLLFLKKLRRQREMVAKQRLGKLLRIDSCFRVKPPSLSPADFRLSFELGGGAALDMGCYAAACLRFIAGAEPEIISVSYECEAPEVDCWMSATVSLPGGVEGSIECGFKGDYEQRFGVRVECTQGSVDWTEAGLLVSSGGTQWLEKFAPDWTHRLQLLAFLARVRGEPAHAAGPDDAIATARIVDSMYAKAGLSPRTGFSHG